MAMKLPLGHTVANVDIFVLFAWVEHVSKFHSYFNTCHPNMSFLDLEISRQQGQFVAMIVYSLLNTVIYTFLPNTKEQITHI